MIQKIKETLLSDLNKLESILEDYGFCKIKRSGQWIKCARDEQSSGNGVSVKLDENISCNDYSRGISGDIFTLICDTHHMPFADVLKDFKRRCGIISTYADTHKRTAFGGFYDRVKKAKEFQINNEILSEDILNDYENAYSQKFAKDYINLDVQDKFGIRYDNYSQSIVIPVRDVCGDLIGIKLRRNYNVRDDEPKYVYDVSCNASQTLFGYCYNYPCMVNGTVLVGESEKFVMQCASYGYNNAVGIGSSSLSISQCKHIHQLNPERIILMFDVGLDENTVEKNKTLLRNYNRMSDVEILCWTGKDFADKESPTDRGKEAFERALQNVI